MTQVARQVGVITPNDTTDLTRVAFGLILTTDDASELLAVRVTTLDDQVITLTNLPTGYILPIVVKRVHVAGTTATEVIGLYR